MRNSPGQSDQGSLAAEGCAVLRPLRETIKTQEAFPHHDALAPSRLAGGDACDTARGPSQSRPVSYAGRRWDPAELGPVVRELLSRTPAPAAVYGV